MLTFIANITFLNDSIRNVPICSGYRPNFKFDNIENTYVDGAIFFNDYERIEKGDINKKVLLKIPRSDLYKKLIFENKNFYFYEGSTLVGKGYIEKII
jgi:hypothetical protein